MRSPSICPSCGYTCVRDPYDIGSGPEYSCVNCEWCWGAEGQPLQELGAISQKQHLLNTSRVDTQQRRFLDEANLQLNLPLNWTANKGLYHLAKPGSRQCPQAVASTAFAPTVATGSRT